MVVRWAPSAHLGRVGIGATANKGLGFRVLGKNWLLMAWMGQCHASTAQGCRSRPAFCTWVKVRLLTVVEPEKKEPRAPRGNDRATNLRRAAGLKGSIALITTNYEASGAMRSFGESFRSGLPPLAQSPKP